MRDGIIVVARPSAVPKFLPSANKTRSPRDANVCMIAAHDPSLEPPIMNSSEVISLGTKLSPLLNGGFFRPLSRPTAAVYVDCAERLVDTADDGGQVDHSEARLLIREVLVRHPEGR